MYKKIFCGFILVLFSSSLLTGQCYLDRHNTTRDAAWKSCSATPNPNTNRGNGHWIMYNFGIKYPLGYLEFWNSNHPDELTNGLKDIKIDISDDGQNWTEVATYSIPIAEASGFYEGVMGPNLNGYEARYLLISAIDNHGGDCYALGEIRIGLSNVPDPCVNMEFEVNNDPLYDGLYHVVNEIESEGLVNAMGSVQFKAGQTISLNNGFTVLDGGDFTAEIEDCNQ